MKAMLAVRGNLAANPRFWPERKDEDGHVLQARWTAVVIETRHCSGADGEWRDDPTAGIPCHGHRIRGRGRRDASTAATCIAGTDSGRWANRRPLKRNTLPAAASRPPACA